MVRSRVRRSLRVALAALIAVEGLHLPSARADDGDAKPHLVRGDAAARGKNWDAAIDEYSRANSSLPSAEALEGLANAHYQLKHEGEAYAKYDEYLKLYGGKISAAKKATAQARLKEIGERTGLLTLDVSEPGATILIDDKEVGKTPLASPLRLDAGPHHVRVTKDGFVAFDQAPNIIAGSTSPIQVKLEAQANKGRLSVHEKTGQPIRIYVDGVDVGDAPWSGELAAGAHDVSGRGAGLAAPATSAQVERGKTSDVELVATSQTARLRVATPDGKGIIYIDDKVVGEGTFDGDVPAGTHRIRVTREGYDSFEEQIDLQAKSLASRAVTLKLSSKIETGTLQREGRRMEGLYGGFNLVGMLLASGMKSSIQTECDDAHPKELTSCDDGGGLGAGVNGFIGYHWDPVGVELFLGGQFDNASPKLVWGPASTDPGIGPDPARTEQFTLIRAGGFGMLRVRLTLQSEKIRFSTAAGVGLAYSVMFLKREATLASDPSIKSLWIPDSLTYLSPALSLDPTIYYRLSQTTAVGLGVTILVESARTFDQIPTTPTDSSQRLGPSGLTTPSYDLTTGAQVFIGPFLGMMFGP